MIMRRVTAPRESYREGFVTAADYRMEVYRKLLRRLCNCSRLSYVSVQNVTKVLKLHQHRVHIMGELKGSDREL
jgi:hypothetical protein